MDIKSLTVFCDLAEDLHYGRVADRHAMSASTLSRLVQRLEAEVGQTLLARDNRNVSLTPAGVQYFAFARNVLLEWQRFQIDVASQSDQLQGAVSLYCSVTASHSLLSAVLSTLSPKYPGIEIRIHTGDQALSVDRVLHGHEDFSIAARPGNLDARLDFLPLAESRLLLIGPSIPCSLSSQIAEMKDGVWSWADLPWILPERGIVRSRLDQWFRAQGFRPNVYAEVSGNEAIASMVSLGLGVGLIPELVLTSSPAFDNIELLSGLADSASLIDTNPFDAVCFENMKIGLCVQKRRLVEPLMQAVWSVATQASSAPTS